MNEWFQRIRMIVCICSISLIGGVITMVLVYKKISPSLLLSTAANLVVLITLYKPELKKLKEKLFGDDDFKGGNFG